MPKHTHTQIEEWRDIPGYEGLYQVSDQGRVRSLDRVVTTTNGQVRRYKGKVLRTPLDKYGYPSVGLSTQSKHQKRTVHTLVAEAFIGLRPEGRQVCHNDGDKTNNHVDNLRYGTPGENELDKVKHGTHRNAVKTHCPRGHELSAENVVTSESKLGRRECLACNRARSRVRRHPELKPRLKAVADSYYSAILEERKIAA